MNKTLALLVRALRTESRDIKSHLFRFGLAAIIVLIVWMSYQSIQRSSAPGREMFWYMTYANWAVVTLAGGSVFAIAISEETEQQTLGLLRMANVSPLSLLLGKWLPRMLTAVVLVSIQFPFTWLTVTLGGVSWPQIWASYLTLLAHLILVGNFGLLISVLNSNSARACGWAFAGMVIARVLPFLCWGVLAVGAEGGLISPTADQSFADAVVQPIHERTAFGRLNTVLSTSFQESAWSPQVVWNLGMGAGLFCISWMIFDRATMRHMSGGPQRRGLLSRLFTRRNRKSALSWDWALGCKDFRQVAGGVRWLLVKTLLYLCLFGIVLYLNMLYGTRLDDAIKTSSGVTAGIIFWVLLPFELSSLAAKLFRPELQNQTWSTLLTLPKSLPEIAYSKLAGALLGAIPAISMLCLCSSPFLDELFPDIFRRAESVLFIIYGLSFVLLALHVVAFFSIAIDWAVWIVAVIMGWVAVTMGTFLLWMLMAIVMMGNRSGGDGLMYVWMMFLIATNLGLTGLVHYGIGQRLIAKGAAS